MIINNIKSSKFFCWECVQMTIEIVDVENGGMWRGNIEKIFIDIMVVEADKDNLENGTFSSHTWKKMLFKVNS